MTIDDVIVRLEGIPGVEHGKGVTAAEVEGAEQALGIRFPRSYQTYLIRLGWLNTPGDWFYGLGTGVPPYAELVTVTMSERTEAQPRIPSQLLPLRNDGGGNHYCLDLRRATKDEAPVVFWDHAAGEDQTPEDWSPSFTAWLKDHVTNLETDAE
jgi:cell wall assembly regulator SMI1